MSYNSGMLKQQIANLVGQYNGSYKHIKDGLFTKTFGSAAYVQVLERTSFLPDDSPFSLRARCVADDVTSHPVCKMCDSYVVFNSNKGWLTYCSNECRFKDYNHIQEKKRDTNLKRYGATNVLASRHVLDKRVKSTNRQETVTTVQNAKYLNENNLGKFITANITTNFLHDKPLPNSESKKRYDYILPEFKLIVEFDGDSHYTSAKAIVNDETKEQLAHSFGYNVIRIPYFIQLDDTMVQHYFGSYVSSYITRFEFNGYPHGFIDEKARKPGDFCELGQKRFMSVWRNLPHTIKMQLGHNLRSISSADRPEVAIFNDIEKYLQELGI